MPRGSSVLPNVNANGDQNINITNAALAVTDATAQASLSAINGKITACDTSAVAVSSSALPTGAATSANQSTANSSLSSISAAMIACDTGNVNIATSSLPTGASTSANQSTANSSLSSIDAKLTSPLSVSSPVTISGSRGNLINMSSVVSGDFTTGIDVSAHTKSSITIKSNSSDVVELWVSCDSGISYDLHGSVWPMQPDSGTDYYAYIKLDNDVVTDVKLKFTGTASTVTASCFSRV